MEILNDIEQAIQKEKRTPEELFILVRNVGLQMAMSNKINKDQVVLLCSALIKMYQLQNMR